MTISIKNDSAALQSEKFIVYGRADCHLCQQMILALEKLPEQVSLDYQVIDIDTDPELVTLYGEKNSCVGVSNTGSYLLSFL